MTLPRTDLATTCPRCGVTLRRVTERDVTLSHCPRCDDWWADHAAPSHEPAVTTERAEPDAPVSTGPSLACAVCGRSTHDVEVGGRVWRLEGCGEDHGFFFNLRVEGAGDGPRSAEDARLEREVWEAVTPEGRPSRLVRAARWLAALAGW